MCRRCQAHLCKVTRMLREVLVGKFAFGDRTIPIHARTQGSACLPKEMGVYYGTVQSAVVHTN